MYNLTINYMNGETVCSSFETFPQVQQAINAIDKLVDSIEMHHEVEEYDIDEQSHLSWGI
jgi:uncharacterized protein YegP (UPF0339 family)